MEYSSDWLWRSCGNAPRENTYQRILSAVVYVSLLVWHPLNTVYECLLFPTQGYTIQLLHVLFIILLEDVVKNYVKALGGWIYWWIQSTDRENWRQGCMSDRDGPSDRVYRRRRSFIILNIYHFATTKNYLKHMMLNEKFIVNIKLWDNKFFHALYNSLKTVLTSIFFPVRGYC
jgi:hypothetical protein